METKGLPSFVVSLNFIIFAFHFNMETLNRLKAVLAEELEKSPVTVSKWCTNPTQPNLPTLSKIAKLLYINPKDLIIGTNNYRTSCDLLRKYWLQFTTI